MSFGPFILIVLIALVYNLFVHYFTSMIYKDYPYTQKFSNTLVTLFVAGIFAVVMGKLILPDHPKYNNIVVNKGLLYGGILLIITSLFVNWENMGDELRLIMMGFIFGFLIWLSYKYLDSGQDQEDKEADKEVAEIMAVTEN